jgi:hypothetical protein
VSLGNTHVVEHWLTLANTGTWHHHLQQEDYEGSSNGIRDGFESVSPVRSLGNTHLVEESHWAQANTGTWHAAGRLRRVYYLGHCV